MKIFKHLGNFVVTLCALMAVAAHTPVWATEELDPFSIDGGKWMSFDHYKQKTQRLPASAPAPAAENSDKTSNETPATATTVSTPNKATAASEPEPAALSRPINVPVMPGVNKGFQMQISSTTADEESARATISNLETTPTVTLPQSNWQSPEEAMKAQELIANDSDPDNPQRKNLKVRMTYLPNRSIKPEERSKAKAPAPVAKSLFTPKGKSPEEQAACAAVNAYKQQQLDAIQRDNQTLQALQAAIADLGLQKELSFMAGGMSAAAPSNNASNKIWTATTPQTAVK